jgi:sugar/nucleoside kinase (ribokinase family)
MSILVVGSVAFDSIETPKGKAVKCLGGAATHFALAASYFTDVRVIAVVGDDFGREQEAVFVNRGIDVSGIEHAAGKSFHWTGSYSGAMNEATTLGTDLNVFAEFAPKIPEVYRDSQYLFLANIDPILQARVRAQMPKVKLVCGDTMNYWIADHRVALNAVLRELDVLLINDGEAKMLAGGEPNMVLAARNVLAQGPKAVVIKHGEYGATAFFSDSMFGGEKIAPFRAPALPIAEVVDPTGAGDSFAGGFYGYIASQPRLTPAVFRRALFYGGVMGSFAVERFGTARLENVTREQIESRLNLFVELSHLNAAEDLAHEEQTREDQVREEQA